MGWPSMPEDRLAWHNRLPAQALLFTPTIIVAMARLAKIEISSASWARAMVGGCA